MDLVDPLLTLLQSLPPELILILLGAGAALENFFPPVPADTFVLLGGFLAGRGQVGAWTVFFVTWGANVASALAVYGIGHRYGRSFFETGAGRHILAEPQLRRMRRFYERWGTPALFLTRFVPGFRAVVPAFAGVSRQRLLPVALPLASASALWYGALVWLGAQTGRNLETLVRWLTGANRVLLAVAVLLGAGLAWWWLRTRKRESSGEDPGEGDAERGG